MLYSQLYKKEEILHNLRHTHKHTHTHSKKRTDGGEEVIEPLFGEEWVLKPPEVELEHASHRVNVMVVLLICQGVVA